MGQSFNLKTTDYRVAGSYVTGKSHLKRNIPCQDRTFSNSLNGTTVITLADGAGSCSKSEIGAEIVTQYVADFLCTNFDNIFQKEETIISKTILEGISKSLSQKAKTLNLTVLDLSSTLLFVGVKDNRYLAGHIGDGLIGCFDGKDIKTLSYPENGEFSNQTYFATKDNAINHFRIYKADKNNYLAYYPIGSQKSIKKNMLITSDIKKLNNINGFILMSDGSYDCLYDKNENRLTDANMTIFSWLQDGNNTIDEVEKALKDNIESKFLKKTHDDCSINLLALTEDKIKVKEVKKVDLTLDLKQLADNTKRIDQLQSEINSVKTSLDGFYDRFSDTISKNEFKNYRSNLDKSKSKHTDNAKKISQLQKDVKGIKSELSNSQNSLNEKNDKISGLEKANTIEEIKSIKKWNQNVKTWLIIVSSALAGIIATLLFFN